jgi:hypothetical protein
MDFDTKKFADLLKLAKGSQRSINSYGKECDVDPGYISRFLREKTKYPPSPQIILKLAKNAANGITAKDLMSAAGHWSDNLFDKKMPRKKEAQEFDFRDIFQKFTITYKDTKLTPNEIESLNDYLEFLRFRSK